MLQSRVKKRARLKAIMYLCLKTTVLTIKIMTMDWNEVMKQYAPTGSVTVLSKENRMKDWARQHNKKLDELTEEDMKAEQEAWEAATGDPLDASRG